MQGVAFEKVRMAKKTSDACETLFCEELHAHTNDRDH